MGASGIEGTGRRYAILTHDHPFFHWDLLLESGEVAWTWRLFDEPEAGRPVRAERIGDHRLLYLDYEGPVSGGRGSVTCWDAGTYEIVEETPAICGIRLDGERGEWTLELRLVP